MMRWRVWRAFTIGAGGIVLGVAAFLLTGQVPDYFGLLGCDVLEQAAFDPWSGLGRGRLLACRTDLPFEGLPTRLTRETAPLAAFGFRHALPLTIGVPLGCLAIAIGPTLSRAARKALVGEVGVEPTRRSRGTGS